jgi:amino acid adenylation domain-containing protein
MSQPSFIELIARNAIQYAERPAFSSGDSSYSYRQFFAIARGIHDEIARMGYGNARRIGIVAGDSVHTSASILSIWSVGAAFVSLNVHYPAERNARIIEDAGLDLVLTSRPGQEWPRYLPRPDGTFQLLHTSDIEPASAPLTFPAAKPSDLAYLFFTSGSTGIPKGVPISHANLSAFMNTYLSGMGYDFTQEDRFLQMFALTFDLSVVSTVAPLSVGGCCCTIPQTGIAYMNIANVLARQRVTVALMVPSVLPYLRRFFNELNFPSLRLNQFCGEALMQDIVSEWSHCVPNARIENVYGPTEATIFCTSYVWTRDRGATESVNGIVPIGKAMPGTSTYVVNDAGERCEDGERGELCLAGHQVMTGYWNDSVKTGQSFVSLSSEGMAVSAYRTGDIVYVNENGDLVYCGRKDAQVKIDGHRVELGEIEHFARSYVGSPTAAAVMVKDAAGFDRLRLFVGARDIDSAALESYLKSRLPDYMWPASITVLAELPLNLNGKIDRPALAKML